MPTNLIELIRIFTDLIATAIPVLAGLALLAFFWGLVKFIAKAGDEKAVNEGKSLMVWGLIAIFVMVSIWGIITFLDNEFGLFHRYGPGLVIPLLPE